MPTWRNCAKRCIDEQGSERVRQASALKLHHKESRIYLLKQWVAGMAALLVFLPSTGLAAGIVLKNSMGSDIKAVFCVGNHGDKKPAVGGLAKKSSKTVSPAKFPEHDCTRIGVIMQNGMGWQYYHEPEPGSAKEIEFGMDAAGRNEKRK